MEVPDSIDMGTPRVPTYWESEGSDLLRADLTQKGKALQLFLIGWWTLMFGLSAVLLMHSPILVASKTAPTPILWWALHAIGAVMLWAFAWGGIVWGSATLIWMSVLSWMVALSLRHEAMLLYPLGYLFLGVIVYRGVHQWQALLRESGARGDRFAEQLHTLEDECQQMEANQETLENRLQQYQKIRQVANAFNLTLSMEGLMDCVVQSAGEVVENAERVLLYMADDASMQLELKMVWRRLGHDPIPAKHGDEFDHWVMRQSQPLLVQEPARDFRFPHVSTESLGRTLGAVLVVPLVTEHQFLGVLRLETSRSKGLGPDDLRLARLVGDLASLGIENSKLYQQMVSLAMTDDLTGLAVRKVFSERLEEELDKCKEKGGSLAVAMIDIDHFKQYNDQFGHSSGDKLLKHISHLLGQMLRPHELVARYGGEEFVVLFPDLELKAGIGRAEIIRQQVESVPVELRRELAHTTVSIGVASFPADGDSVESLLQVSDKRLYQAKGAGRNQVCPKK